MIDLSGKWDVVLNTGMKGEVTLPGILEMQGYGDEISYKTEFMSGLHNPFWFERKEYSYAQNEGVNVPFLCQPIRKYVGKAVYTRRFTTLETHKWYLLFEISKWNLTIDIDGVNVGEETHLCYPFTFSIGVLDAGEHVLSVTVDNSQQLPYRPDGHSVSDALGACWNGIGGKMVLMTGAEMEEFEISKREYYNDNRRNVVSENGRIWVDGYPVYLRGTHFGGDYPLTGIASTDPAYWKKFMKRLSSWGINFIRCHSYCPPDEFFCAADKEGIFVQVECGMWNDFTEKIPMIDVLKHETEGILTAFGHHPSLIMMSPSNEPGGDWYSVLKEWVDFATKINKELGYGGSRIFTAQSGWPYDTEPSDVTGVDYLFFHRSGFGPYNGGTIRNPKGWRGKDYSPSLEGTSLPVLAHEMGQWCAYPDFDVIDKFTGFLQPSNFKVFRENARANNVLQYNKAFAYASGKNQLRLLKEEFEANYRTKEIVGFEYLDLHDYIGQGGAYVGVLDALWDPKSYADREEFLETMSDTVILQRLPSYVFTSEDTLRTPIEICHFGKGDIKNAELNVKLYNDRHTIYDNTLTVKNCPTGENTTVGEIVIPFDEIDRSEKFILRMTLLKKDKVISQNHWDITVFVKDEQDDDAVVVTKDLKTALTACEKGKKVVYTPWMSDLDYDCPPLSMRNVFWNAQMGPKWGRSLGIIADAEHPLFKYFPTEATGGWMWEEILSAARGFNIDPDYKNIVRAIDDWNRNFPLSLIFEGKVSKGKMIVISADLDGTFEERPACFALKNAILKYVKSSEFNPEQELKEEDLEKHIMSVPKGADIVKSIKLTRGRTKLDAAVDMNPDSTAVIKNKRFPVSIDITFKKEIEFTSLYYLTPQRDRDFLGCIRDYRVLVDGKVVSEGRFENTLEGQKTIPCKVTTSSVTFEVLNTYGRGYATRWEESEDGWYKRTAKEKNIIQIAALHVLYNDNGRPEHSDGQFWRPQEPQKNMSKDLEE